MILETGHKYNNPLLYKVSWTKERCCPWNPKYIQLSCTSSKPIAVKIILGIVFWETITFLNNMLAFHLYSSWSAAIHDGMTCHHVLDEILLHISCILCTCLQKWNANLIHKCLGCTIINCSQITFISNKQLVDILTWMSYFPVNTTTPTIYGVSISAKTNKSPKHMEMILARFRSCIVIDLFQLLLHIIENILISNLINLNDMHHDNSCL